MVHVPAWRSDTACHRSRHGEGADGLTPRDGKRHRLAGVAASRRDTEGRVAKVCAAIAGKLMDCASPLIVTTNGSLFEPPIGSLTVTAP